MPIKKYNLATGITLYRLLSAPILLLLAVLGWFPVFKWLLALSFFTDAIDGILARHQKVVSRFGARLDSIADDLTVLVGITALFLYRPYFFHQQFLVFLFVFLLFGVQAILAFVRFGRASSFHTYGAKLAAVLQGLFLIIFFFTKPILPLFYAAAIITAVELAEEIILVFLVSSWQVDVKGLFWVLQKNKSIDQKEHLLK